MVMVIYLDNIKSNGNVIITQCMQVIDYTTDLNLTHAIIVFFMMSILFTQCSLKKIYNTFDDDKQFDVTKKYVLL